MSSPREILRQAKAVMSLARQLQGASSVDEDEYWIIHGFVRIDQANTEMAARPVETLDPVAASAELASALKAAGVTTVLDALGGPKRRPPAVPGIDGGTSAAVTAAADAAWNAFLLATDVEFTPKARTDNQTRLLEMLHRLVESSRATDGLSAAVLEFAAMARPLVKTARPATSRLVGLFAGPAKRARAAEAVAALEAALAPIMLRDIPTRLAESLNGIKVARLEDDALWDDLRAHPADYEAAMDQIGRPVLREGD